MTKKEKSTRWKKGKRNINFGLEEGSGKEIKLLTQNLEMTSISQLMRHIIYEYCIEKKKGYRNKIYERIVKKLKETYKNKNKSLVSRIDMILELNKQIDYMNEIEEEESKQNNKQWRVEDL